jgi:hypothetical protein
VPASRLRLCGHQSEQPGRHGRRVLVNVDTRHADEMRLSTRFAYVSISRARYEAKICTDNAQAIGAELSREISKRAAIEQHQGQTQTQRKQGAHQESHDFGYAL